jgi:hypothetical protein
MGEPKRARGRVAQVLWTWGNDSPTTTPPRLKTWGTRPGGAEETHDATHPPPFQGGEGKEHRRGTGSAMFAGLRSSLHPFASGGNSWAPLRSQEPKPKLPHTR